MNFARLQVRHLLVLSALTVLFASCSSNEEYKKRLDKRDESYSNYNERVKMRREARQERTDMWYDRAMGKPASVDTGLRVPSSSSDKHDND